MLVPFLIMLREGIEAALIVGIVASYLRQTGRGNWMPAVWCGIILAIGLSLSVFAALYVAAAEFPQRTQELFEAVVGVIAVCLLTTMVFWMHKAVRTIKAELQHSIDEALASHDHQGMALVGMVFLAVAREGLESVFFLLATFEQNAGYGAPIGAFLGLACAVAFGVALYYGGARLNLRMFFRWTSILIIFVAAGLVATALRSLHEAGLWNYMQGVAFDVSGILPDDSAVGSVLAGIFGYTATPSNGEFIAYLLYLLPALFLFLRAPAVPSTPTSKAAQS
ncbi:iron transporter [Labrys miyagiensis]|uniref:Iron transporter n=1 Tax=Labrys miyagiensis TaxID=346912 RepID=A0ABQ6CMG0_9HYPH|nr:iron uptake transporter permease EfeU [Labrys miyagiensis]GLS19446.1 iron transporter [Labrys miyagiensis]